MPYIEFIDNKIGHKLYTLEEQYNHYDEHINSKYFVDFFTYFDGDYKQVDASKVDLPIKIRTETYTDYLFRLKTTTKSEKAIPVISIKKGRENLTETDEIIYIIKELQKLKEQIAIRIEGELFHLHFKKIKETLRASDYFFYDILEDNIDPYILDIMELEKTNSFIKILTNSPRKKDITNNNYLKSGYTDLIDNFARDDYKSYGFNGYSDYSGLKDDLPKSGGDGYSGALAVLYDHTNNKYYTITNKDTSEGISGYGFVIEEIQKEEMAKKLRLNDCLAYNYLKENNFPFDKTGNYATWNFITLLRVLSEMKIVYRWLSVDYFIINIVFKKPLII